MVETINGAAAWETLQQPGAPALLYIDLHLVHEVTSPQAFQGLRERGLKVRRPDLTIATADHSIPTTDRSLAIVDEIAGLTGETVTIFQRMNAAGDLLQVATNVRGQDGQR